MADDEETAAVEVTARYVLYCPKCGMPPEYCEYGPDFETHCLPWLKKNHFELAQQLHPTLVKKSGKPKNDNDNDDDKAELKPWTTEERLHAFYDKYVPEKKSNIPGLLEKYKGKEENLFVALVRKYGPEPDDPYIVARWGKAGRDDDDDDDVEGDGNDDDGDGGDADKDKDNDDDEEADGGDGEKKKKKEQRRGVAAKKVTKLDTRIVIQKLSRNKKKAVTAVVGMDTVPDVHLKDVAKAFSKRFAGSSSVKDMPGGGKEIIIQGDHTDDVAAMIVDKFKVSPDCVFLDIDGEFVPYA